jgi:hypothetical protein
MITIDELRTEIFANGYLYKANESDILFENGIYQLNSHAMAVLTMMYCRETFGPADSFQVRYKHGSDQFDIWAIERDFGREYSFATSELIAQLDQPAIFIKDSAQLRTTQINS